MVESSVDPAMLGPLAARIDRPMRAAAGWELAAPTASRFVHLDWAMPYDVFAEVW
ncbi:hypothetical protein [Demequina rhizosphaerae]|uniref:hypothetical protein n=1 Tax=Demequina rhizosphaerae TaxID=1638985 RepID=UPI0012E00CFC|nr:hypothetical protein [Demequina rhizosphaerae]